METEEFISSKKLFVKSLVDKCNDLEILELIIQLLLFHRKE